MIPYKFLTGKTRLRPLVLEGKVLLILQVEEGCNAPIKEWRDASIEDLRGKEIEVRT